MVLHVVAVDGWGLALKSELETVSTVRNLHLRAIGLTDKSESITIEFRGLITISHQQSHVIDVGGNPRGWHEHTPSTAGLAAGLVLNDFNRKPRWVGDLETQIPRHVCAHFVLHLDPYERQMVPHTLRIVCLKTDAI